MKIKVKKAHVNAVILLVLGVLLFVSFIGVSFVSHQDVYAVNVTNQTVRTTVFVWNTEPNLYDVTIDPDPIDLTANNITVVNCTGRFFDYNGWQDVANGTVNATFYDVNSTSSGASGDNNQHYSNSSCEATCQEITGSSGQNGTCSCHFHVQYYANASDWQCNMTIFDSGINITDPARNKTFNSSRVANATITRLIGIDVPLVIDFGNLSVTEISEDVRENITNTGNTHINVTVRGYGGDNESNGSGLSMFCDLGNITINATRFSVANGSNYETGMINLSPTDQQIAGLTVFQRLNDVNKEEGRDINATFWKIQIPLSVGGRCNGTVIFSALEAFP